MLRLLWGSPLPPVRSGVSDYAVELLPALAEHAGLRVLTPPHWQPPPEWPLDGVVELVPGDSAARPDELSIIHLGNNPHHEWLLPRLKDPRTVVVAHDLVLHHLLVEATLARGDWAGYGRLLTRAYGAAGTAMARARARGFNGAHDPFLLPARRAFLGDVRAVVVHSRWAARQVVRDLPELPVATIAMPARDPGLADRGALRRRLGISEDEVVAMHLGFLTPQKGLAEILVGMAAAVRCGVSVRLVLVGEGCTADAVDSAVRELGLIDRVLATGWVDPDSLVRLPAAADLGVVLRTPSAGETSAAVLRFLAAGTPAAVTGVRQFLEWPEAAAPRVTPGDAAAADLARLLCSLADVGQGEAWAGRRRAARAVWERGHNPAAVARELAAFLGQVA